MVGELVYGRDELVRAQNREVSRSWENVEKLRKGKGRVEQRFVVTYDIPQSISIRFIWSHRSIPTKLECSPVLTTRVSGKENMPVLRHAI